jgi:hypothetical protein
MGIKFNNNWKVADPYYTRRYGNYQVFLDSVNQQQIMQAFWLAAGHYSNFFIKDLLNDAAASQGQKDVIVEQGVHQAEDLNSGGFILHFTVRNRFNRAYHFYIKQWPLS